MILMVESFFEMENPLSGERDESEIGFFSNGGQGKELPEK